eukprot:16370415-Heterocapsa_arctica.AAC.1
MVCQRKSSSSKAVVDRLYSCPDSSMSELVRLPVDATLLKERRTWHAGTSNSSRYLSQLTTFLQIHRLCFGVRKTAF